MKNFLKSFALLSTLAFTACSMSTSSTTTSPFTVDNSNGYPNYYGTVSALPGYATIVEKQEAFCTENCKTYQYVYFNILEQDNIVPDDVATLYQYIKENAGNSFLTENGIGLGCVDNGVIHYQNDSEKGQVSKELGTVTSSVILNSTVENPVEITLRKDAFEPGKGEAPDCYSHFSWVTLSQK